MLFQELNIEKQKYNGLLRKYEADNGHSTEQLRHELISTEKVTIEQRQYYTKQIEQLEREKIDLRNELNQLRDVLKDLHEQISMKEDDGRIRLKIGRKSFLSNADLRSSALSFPQ